MAENLSKIKKLLNKEILFAFDFDGTLSKITTKIDGAILPKHTQDLLLTLSKQAPVAIVSGRGLEDLKKRIKLPNIRYIGNHGLEGLSTLERQKIEAEKISRHWLKYLKNELIKSKLLKSELLKSEFYLANDDGVFIEDKKYSLSIHYREAKDRTMSSKKIKAIINELSPHPRIIGGKCVYNIVPKKSPNKGSAILELKKIEKVKYVFYVGDDETDEDVFCLKNKSIMTVRVGKKMGSKAMLYLKRQSQINKLLKTLIL